MRAVVQKTLTSSVTSDGVLTGQAGSGLTVLLGVSVKDTEADVRYLADKIVHLRIFEDDQGKLNHSLLDVPAISKRPSPNRPKHYMSSSSPLSAPSASPWRQAVSGPIWSYPWQTTGL